MDETGVKQMIEIQVVARMNGMRVYASEDGEIWVNLFVLTNLSGSKWFYKINVNVSAAVAIRNISM